METPNDKNKEEINGFSEKPYSKIEPVTNHDAGLTNDNEELYGTPQVEVPEENDNKESESSSKSEKEIENSSDEFTNEEDIVKDKTTPLENNDQDCFDKQYGKDSIPKPKD